MLYVNKEISWKIAVPVRILLVVSKRNPNKLTAAENGIYWKDPVVIHRINRR